MKAEIRKDVREYILGEVNLSLARLGVSEAVKETQEYEDKYNNVLQYEFESAPIRQMPMMFKRLYVEGYMTVATPKNDNDRYFRASKYNHIVVVRLSYRYNHFDGGSNGCDIGRMVFLVDKDLPTSFDKSEWIEPSTYIRKAEGLDI